MKKINRKIFQHKIQMLVIIGLDKFFYLYFFSIFVDSDRPGVGGGGGCWWGTAFGEFFFFDNRTAF